MNLSKDIVAGSVILILSAVLWWVTTTFDSDPLGLAQGMPATHMPRLILTVMAGLTLLMMAQSIRKAEKTEWRAPPWRVGATAVLLGTIALLFSTLGLPLAFFAVCALLPVLWGSRNYPVIAVFAVCVPAAIYVIFKILLGLRLPVGPLSALGL